VTASAPALDAAQPLAEVAQAHSPGRARADGTALFEASYRTHREDIYRLCMRYGGGRPAWAEDVVHDVFMKLLEHLPELEDPEHVGGWLYRVAANLSVSRLRREQSWVGKLRVLLAGDDERDRPADEVFEEHETAAAAMETLRTLPARERVVLCMKVLDGRSQKEIAEALELSEGYVSKLCARAWERVRGAGWDAAGAPGAEASDAAS
jgi:RNA polymerase sigma factor (sigma-70 family)